MQVLVLYYSKGGNTRKLAEQIAEGVRSVSGVEALLRSTQEVTKEDFVNSAGIVAGSPVYFGAMASDLKRVFDEFVVVRKKIENKVGAAFATSADPSGGKETDHDLYRSVFADLRHDRCGGPDGCDEAIYGVACVGAPDEKAVANARKLGKRVAELCKKLHS